MSLLTRSYNFQDGQTAYGSQVESEIANIVNTLNSLDQGNTSWTEVDVTTLTLHSDLAMGGNKVTGMGTPTLSGDAVTLGYLQSNYTQSSSVIVSGSTANSGGSQSGITQGTVSTPDFRTNAVTLTSASASSGSIVGPSTITSANITTIGKPVLIIATASILADTTSGGAAQVTLAVRRGTTAITGARSRVITNLTSGVGAVQQSYNMSILATDSQAAGSYTYNLDYVVNTGSNGSVTDYSLVVIELRA